MEGEDGPKRPLHLALRSSSTSLRIAELRAIHEKVLEKGFSEEQLRSLVNLLFSTYPAYNDRASRREALDCALKISRSSTTCLSDLIGLLQVEASKPGLAPANVLVLIEWTASIIELCVESIQQWERYGGALITALSQLVELVCALETRSGIRQSTFVVTRRALRKVFKTRGVGEQAIKSIVVQLAAKSTFGYKSSVLLGIVAGVCARLRPAADRGKNRISALPEDILKSLKDHYYSFWVREVIGSKTLVPHHIATSFYDFFSSFTTLEDLQKEIVPALEKALLRAPEVVLNDLISPLVTPLPSEIDLSDVLANRLVKPLLSNIKSTNSDIRNGAVSAFSILLERSRDDVLLEKILSEILNPLTASKILSADQRALYARILASVPPGQSRSRSICDGIANSVSKEPNEIAAAAQANAMICHLTFLLVHTSEKVDMPINAIVKGLSDKKASIQKLWALKCGDILWQIKESTAENVSGVQIIECVLPKLLEMFTEVISNPISATQFGLIVAGYVVTSLQQLFTDRVEKANLKALWQKSKVFSQALAYDTKPSFLLNSRIYSRLSLEDDFRWLVRALGECSNQVCTLDPESAVANAWAQAYFYSITASAVTANIRKEATEHLSTAYQRNPTPMVKVVVGGLWTWYRNVELEVKDSAAFAAQTGMTKTSLIIRAISLQQKELDKPLQSISKEVLESQLIYMLALFRPEIIPGITWIDLCLRLGQDPGDLATQRSHECIDRVNSILASNDKNACPSSSVRVAAYNAFAELAFVAPTVITPLLVNQITDNLAVEDLLQYGPTDFAIARTPDGTAFIDVLNKKAPAEVLDKGASDYDTLKWEAEVRAQQATKKGMQKKLTTDEQSKVNTQLAKEASIRAQVLQLEMRLQRGVGIIHGLAIGPPTDANTWMAPSLKALIEVIEAGFGLLAGDSANQAFLACANFVTSRLGTSRQSIGIATLRSLCSTHLPDNLSQEPLGELVTRTLYRLRLAGEQRPFDSVSLTYTLPLLFIILRRKGVGHSDSDSADEQVTLALEFLSFHTDIFSTYSISREQVINVLIQSMQKYTQHHKLVKDCLLDLCRAIAAKATSDEIRILLKGAIVPQVAVRTAVLQGVREDIDLTDLDFSEEIWLASHDDVEENADLGHNIWQENALEVESKDTFRLLTYLSSSDKQLRRAAARSISACLSGNTLVFEEIRLKLQDEYREKAKPRVPERDAFGMIKKTDLSDPWEARSGVALAFKELAPVWEISKLVPCMEFLIYDKALGDQNPSVRDDMIECATSIISIHGGKKLEELMKMFEDALEASGRDAGISDLVSEAVVILYGALARHLKAGDGRVPKVVEKLLETLSTPSETVQYAVAECLPPLVRTSLDKTSDYVQDIIDRLLNSKKYATRRGAGYGLAGIVSGKGVSALREFRIMSTLKGAIENKKDQNSRQGALFAYELFSLILGRTFEPYVIQIVPQLIASFGDASADVREACLDAAKTCFASLSSYGVKVILPTLLEGLEEQQWRSKKGACDLLGAMAYLDPQQLALSLPDIIPPLTNVLNDSHKEVRSSANRSLQRFGEVISNPEVKSLVNVLLKALSDATKYTDDALDALIKVSFIHYLDAPSLALISRILERGLGDRSATKRKSAQIIGSLAHLTERKDLISHLPILVAGLRVAVVDPVPTTRATSSKALGSLVEKLGEDALPDLIPDLMATLKSDTGAGDRLGSAQALSEILAGLGTGRLEDTLPTILQNVSSSRPSVREGFMSLFIFLPACFGNSFAAYLSKIIPPILAGLADEVESIRETSLRAGRLLVKNFATKAIDLLLPELDRGLADDSYRIRLSSVELVGDLLFNLTGISARAEQDEDETGAAEAGQSLLEVLGEEKRNKILSSLYICRNDTSGLVRTAAVNVWKALVASPRTLKELIPTLTQAIIRRLGSSNMEQKVIAGNSLGELIRKAGEGVLATLLPTLEEGLQTSTDADNKQGICIALREIITSASPEILEDYEKTLISVVRTALVDSDEEVRDTAAEAFDSLQQIFGKKAVDQVLPHLLNLLRTEGEADTALSALLTLLTDNTRSSIILPNLVPTLITSPITSFNAKAIASLAEVAGSSMSRRLPTILNALMDNIISCKDEELKSELEGSFDIILQSTDEFDGLNTAMSVMLALTKHDDHRRRANAGIRLCNFFANSEVDFSRYNQDLIRVLLLSFSDRDSDVVKAAWTALTELMKHLRKEEMESLVVSTRQIVQQVGVAGHNLPGFCLPKGINAILPVFLQGLMNGTAEQRTQAALAISDIIDRTSPDALKPFVTNITGPLIRVVSERSVELKSAILLTLNNLLEKIPLFLKPFLPQLQRTFAKSLADTTSDVLRSRAAKALGTLLTLKPRVDPLIAELVAGTKTPDNGVRNAMLKALYEVVSKAGDNMSEASRNAILGLIDSDSENDDSTIITNARLLGALIKNLSPTEANALTKHRAVQSRFTPASILNLNSILVESPSSLTDNFAQETPNIICQGISSKQPFISDNAVLAAGKFLLHGGDDSPFEATKPIFEALASVISPGNPIDTRRLALVVVRTMSRRHGATVRPHLPLLTPPIFAGVRDMVIPVKLASEAAFLSLFDVVELESAVFDKYISGPSAAGLNAATKKSMQDYFKRVALRLAGQAKERAEAEGGQGGLGLSKDEVEDEREIWSVGKVELGNAFSDE